MRPKTSCLPSWHSCPWPTAGTGGGNPDDAWTDPDDAWTDLGDAWTDPGDAWTDPGDAWTHPDDAWTDLNDARTDLNDARTDLDDSLDDSLTDLKDSWTDPEVPVGTQEVHPGGGGALGPLGVCWVATLGREQTDGKVELVGWAAVTRCFFSCLNF